MSGLSSAFMFGGHFSHSITCIAGYSSTIITGSTTGEIVYWKKHENYTPGVFCALPTDSACISLCIVPANKEISAMCSTQWLVVSLHEKSKIRMWDSVDGKCLAYSTDLFAENNDLSLLTKSIDDFVLVAGKTEIYMIDVYRMQSVKFFYTERNILSIVYHKNKIYAQTIGKMYIFDLQDDFENSSCAILDVWVNVEENTYIEIIKDLIVIGNSQKLYLLSKDSKSETPIQKLNLSDKIRYLAETENSLLICLDGLIKIYKQSDIIKYYKDPRHIPNHERIITGSCPNCYGIIHSTLVFSDGSDLKTLNIESKNIDKHKWNIEEQSFNILNIGEKVTAYNLCINNSVLIGVGTDIGRVILTTLTHSSTSVYFNKKSEVLSIYMNNNILAVGYKDETLSFWSYTSCKGTTYHTLPLKTIEIWTSPVKIMVPLSYSKKNIDHLNEMSWKNSKSNWKTIILAQCETGAVMLTCFEKLDIVSYFQALKSSIVKATMFLNLEYLAISCANGHIYIFNMTVLALEREIIGDAVLNFDSIELIDDKLSKSLDRTDRFTACYEFYYAEPVRKCIEIKYITLGCDNFPVLHINLAKIVKEKPEMIAYVIPVMNSGNLRCGIYGKSNAFAFKNEWVKSLHLNAVRVASMIALNLPPPTIHFNNISMIVAALPSNSNLRGRLLEFITVSNEIINVCENILKPHSKQVRYAKRTLKHSLSINFSCEKYHSQRIFVSIPEVIAIVALSCACIKGNFGKPDLVIEHLIIMIKSSDEGYILLATELLNRGLTTFSKSLQETQVSELSKELLLYSCKNFKNIAKDYFYKIATKLGLIHIQTFIKTLTSDIKNQNLDKNYQQQIFFTIEYFILHHFIEATSILEELGDFILKANNIKNDFPNKLYGQHFTTVLQTFVGLLPMVSLSSDSKLMIIGLPTGLVYVYDLKTSRKWKPLKVFTTTISALDIKENCIACYSCQESCVKIIKIEQGILGSIIGNGEMKIVEKLLLGEIESVATTYQELMRTVRVRWVDMKTLSIFRENKQEYLYMVKKVN
ncbi:hypothetical protein SteCoe_1900 [Stentor coeruleus]|uniref:4Fe-4S ferredoxin-type domain-containing protein n=1 Tax=Stentor coeruleus TaxID=5963 RepID=A0A1R2D0X1_9CILI|nr:hypothetical protein SteCoe_1900 [Stentor coeruleus]